MNKGHCITICLVYLFVVIGFLTQRTDIASNYRISLNYLKELNERFEIETQIINEIKAWLIIYESDENYWPFSDYLHYKDLNCIAYDNLEFKMMIYYDSYEIYDYEVVVYDKNY